MCDRGCPACASFAFGQLWLSSLFRNCSSPHENRRCSFSSPLRQGLCPAVSIHTTNCYLCFYTAPLTRLPKSVESAVCHLWFRNTLAARPCKSLALRLATIGSTGDTCQCYVMPSKSQLLFATLVLQSPTCQALSSIFKGVGGTRALAHLYNN